MATTMALPSVTLYYRQGTSDKVYQANIEGQGSGYVVNFAFGRRGNTMQTGTKTDNPVSYQSALIIYDKLVDSKKAKGYTEGQSGTPFLGASKSTVITGVFPQLLNPIDKDEADELIRNDDWWMQEKFDGKRILVQKSSDRVDGINRKGIVVALPEPIVQQVQATGDSQWLMDGEEIGDVYFAFDLLEYDNTDLREKPYSYRLDFLTTIVTPGERGAIRMRDTAKTTAQKSEMLAALRRLKAEGVVFKRYDAHYTPGRPNSGGDQLKLKFTATASCIVAPANGTRRSVSLILLDGNRDINVGNVTIPPNRPIPKNGSIVEVRYLYAYKGGSLYQPVFLGVRDDIDADACTLGQLKYKAESEEEI